jgi:hypothetical protein
LDTKKRATHASSEAGLSCHKNDPLSVTQDIRCGQGGEEKIKKGYIRVAADSYVMECVLQGQLPNKAWFQANKHKQQSSLPIHSYEGKV